MKTVSLLAITVLSLQSVLQAETLPLTRNGQAVCKVVPIVGDKPELLMRMARDVITDTVKQWDRVALDVLEVNANSGQLPAESAIVLSTWDRLKKLLPNVQASNDVFLRLAFFDEHSFVCVPLTRDNITWMCVIARTPRGVYNGAVYLRDFLIDGAAGDLRLDLDTVVRTPHMQGRPAYLLTLWAEEDEYTADDYKPVLESFARDGMTHVYFWLSGHFPSKKFPQTYKIKDNNWDSTTDSGIPTLEDQRWLIRYSHELGLGFYIGGALGGWCGTFNITNRQPGTMRTGSHDESGNKVSEWVLCPSSRSARQTLIEYYKEMYDALPEADGLYLESADEYGECQCERCSVPIDDLGSKMFGQYQLTLVQEIMQEIWKDHPKAKLAYTIGYSPHVKDPAYYEVVRQMSADPRIEWMEARNSWEFPDSRGKPLPAAYFSPKVMRWDYLDKQPLDKIVRNTMRVASSGMFGYIATFSPGFDSGSFYHDVPFPTDLLPYVLSHFAYREATWIPVRTVEEMKARTQRRFFGKEAPATLSEDLWSLRWILRECAGKQIGPKNRKAVDQMQKRVRDARANASPKTKAGLDLMQRAIDDINKFCVLKTKKTKNS